MTVVVVGDGQAGFQVTASLREGGYPGRVVLVGNGQPPYQRPPLSKAYLERPHTLQQLLFRPREYFDRHGIELMTGPVSRIDREQGFAELASGQRLPYEQVVLATGCRARRTGVPGEHLNGVHFLRDLADAQRLDDHLTRAHHVVIIGAGFIGLEVAGAARKRGADVTVIEFTPQAMGRAVSRLVGEFFVARHRDAGTCVELGTSVAKIQGDGAGRVAAVITVDGTRYPADLVVVGVGVEPNSDIAKEAGLTVDNGVVVDQLLRSVDDPTVSAVGDCARFVDMRSGQSVRLESVQNAVDQARCVARRITGNNAPYQAVPWFWTDQLGLKLQIAGLTAGHDRAVLVGEPATRAFSVFCFVGDSLSGVESVNRAADHLAARRLLAAGGPALAGVTPTVVASGGFSLRQYLAAGLVDVAGGS